MENVESRILLKVWTHMIIVYFLIVEMSMVNIMYQTSLTQFLGLFDESMARSTKSPVPLKRINNIIEFFTYLAFRCVLVTLLLMDHIQAPSSVQVHMQGSVRASQTSLHTAHGSQDRS